MQEKARKLVETARSEGVGGIHRRLTDEATRRGHAQQTAYAGLGGLLGGLLGSFRGPWGAAFGGLLGALFGALLGRRRDRGAPAARLPAPRSRFPLRTVREGTSGDRDWVEVHYRP